MIALHYHLLFERRDLERFLEVGLVLILGGRYYFWESFVAASIVLCLFPEDDELDFPFQPFDGEDLLVLLKAA